MYVLQKYGTYQVRIPVVWGKMDMRTISTYFDFIAGLTQHILLNHKHFIRYFELYYSRKKERSKKTVSV